MAKDNRQKATRGTAGKSADRRTAKPAKVSARAAGSGGDTAGHKKKKKYTKQQKIWMGVFYGIAVLSLVFIGVIVAVIAGSMSGPKVTLEPVNVPGFQTTPASLQNNVAYYVVGLLGENQDPMQMVSVICMDKKAGTASILRVPSNTVTGTDYVAGTVGNVWGNPNPIEWCDTCRRSVAPDEIVDGKHTVCNTPVTTRPGSATESLMGLINQQYGLPTDNYFVLPTGALTLMVDKVQGLDINLAAAVTLNGTAYPAGPALLNGADALAYCETGGEAAQNQVFAALLTRLMALSPDALLSNVLQPVTNSSTPIRTNSVNDPQSIADVIAQLAKVGVDNMTLYRLPGQAGTAGGVTGFLPNKAATLTLLNASFVPYGDKLTDASLQFDQQGTPTDNDTHAQALSAMIIPQVNKITTTTTAASSTDATD
ncbi:MAG: LCP family protein, partial [Oscillospiraceae bacterium]|nr:LCP family protein [Oscillospiraceae bacterium]